MVDNSLVVIVTIEAGEPFAGVLTTDPGVPGFAFSGWIGFMETIEMLRRASGRRDMGRPPDDTTDPAP